MMVLQKKVRMVLITPIRPSTTLPGDLERLLAAFRSTGAKKDSPSPAIKTPTQNSTSPKVGEVWESAFPAVVRAINDTPPMKTLRFINTSIAKRSVNR
ncbi:unannotated protein [freshwater metagenome]|uniref:Unannotated protein n=1 Tax=freshwater metagenome TaxID=449393 RepID=A0A6J7VFC0_9ZZZZ